MRLSFTAATERAIAVAADWCSRTGREELDPPSLLVGLLSEPECRAAVMLRKHGIDIPAVCQKWPTLAPPSEISNPSISGALPLAVSPYGEDSQRIPFSAEVEDSIQIACVRLDFLPRRPELATEHLLLGLVSADHEAAVWLRQQGLDPDSIEAEIRSLHGYTMTAEPAPIDYEEEEPTYRAYRGWTDRAQKVMQLANQEAHRFNHPYIGTEHILLGLAKEGSGVAAQVLKRLGVDRRKIWLELEKLVKYETGAATMGRLPQTPLARNITEHALKESQALRHNYVDTEHILLGLLREREGVAAQVLMNLGLKPEEVRNGVLTVHGRGIQAEAPSTGLPTPPTTSVTPVISAGPPAAPTQTDVLRVLDAAANRGREGLRVVEDYVRFVLDDPHLTGLCKQLRHDLTAALSPLSADSRMTARETQADVGTVLTSAAEQRRDDMASVVRANFARLQESLRSLEEFGKLYAADEDQAPFSRRACTPCDLADQSGVQARRLNVELGLDLAESIKQLRYRTYTLERAVAITRGSIERLAAVRLYVLVDGGESPEAFQRLVVSLIQAGVHAIQLRDKRLGDRELLARARLLRELCGKGDSPIFAETRIGTVPARVLCIINDRPDLAALARADGVHVGQEEVSVKDARRIVGPESLVGVSTHTIEQARAAVLDGANYIGVGPTFPSGTKSFAQFPGLDLLRAVAAEILLPSFAIGGITPENLADVLATGFSRIAVSGAITAAPDPAEATRQLLAALGTEGIAAS